MNAAMRNSMKAAAIATDSPVIIIPEACGCDMEPLSQPEVISNPSQGPIVSDSFMGSSDLSGYYITKLARDRYNEIVSLSPADFSKTYSLSSDGTVMLNGSVYLSGDDIEAIEVEGKAVGQLYSIFGRADLIQAEKSGIASNPASSVASSASSKGIPSWVWFAVAGVVIVFLIYKFKK